MAKKNIRSKGRDRRPKPYSGGKVLAVGLLISLVTASVILAARTTSPIASPAPQSGSSFTPSNPSKEYIYAGSRLVATEEAGAINGNDAEFVSQTIPIEMCGDLGQYYLVTIIMRNTGTTTWTASGGYKLGSQNPANNNVYDVVGRPSGRVNLPHSVAPNNNVTFTFQVSRTPNHPEAGNGLHTFNFQWQMVQDGGVWWFGERSENIGCRGGAYLPSGVADSAQFISQSVPGLMFPGQSSGVSITMINTGTNTWTTAAGYKLGSQDPQDNTTWGLSRVSLPSSIEPGFAVTFTFNVTAPSTPGAYIFQWQMVQEGGAGGFGALTLPLTVAVNSKAAQGYLDFNLDGKTDIATWRSNDIKWWFDYNRDGIADLTQQFYNGRTDLPVAADYNGDGKADWSLLRSGVSSFYFLDLDRNGFPDYTWGVPGGSNAVPVPGDYNGNGSVDPAVFNRSTGGWTIDSDRNQIADMGSSFGTSGDIPVPADYNLDAKTDLAVFRPSTNEWFIDTNLNGTADISIVFGQNGDIPVPMDYNGDGRADLALFRPSTGQWLLDTNFDGQPDLTITFGSNGDIPAPADYDGNGVVDIAVFKPSTTQWLIDSNKDGMADVTVTFGQVSDIPLRQNGWILKKLGILPN